MSGGALRLSRRGFGLGVAAAGVLAGPVAALARPADAPRGPVLSFHRDEPWLDPTGRAQAYLPPRGARSAAPLEHLSDADLRWLQGGA